MSEEPRERFEIHVTKDQLTFCAGHFITYAGGQCERLHGHNYRTAIDVAGSLDENHYVFDFIALKKLAQSITDQLDHRMLLPTQSRLIRVQVENANVRVRHGEREWSFPRDDCVLLPVENTTAELLARHVGRQLLAEMTRVRFSPDRLRVEIEESPGQSALWEWRKSAGGE
jgi:6-pyruvoyltetrahydropterin/6-carboxytetrahydropterin synthase